ncbi:MAG: hypothetical protein KAG56_05140 [Sulfurovaceae bacterium]|nr:hypothetical protein [Sulfurovaceae bacterium]
MCAYYEDEKSRIKKGDKALYQDKKIEIISVTHVKSNKTMDIRYLEGEEKQLPTIPYHGKIENLKLLEREVLEERLNLTL